MYRWLFRGVTAQVVVVLTAAALVAPAAPAAARPAERAGRAGAALLAAPTCTPGKPNVVGSAGDRLTITIPGCTPDTGLIGYRITILAGAAETATTLDVPIGTTRKEVTGLSPGTLYRFRLAARNADGAGPLGVRSADASPPFISIGTLVDRQYLDFTGVAPTATQRSTWVNDIASGAETPIDAVDAGEQQAYWQKQSPIIRLFQAYFLRLPDAGGLNYWVTKYRGGTTLDSISQSFAGSAEFKERYGTLTNKKFVEQVYLNVLGRPGESEGVNFWTGKLNDGSYSRGRVMTGFSESAEYKTKTREQVWIVNFFTGMLRRLPTTAETTTWKPQSRAALIAYLLGTATYAARVKVNAPPAPPGIATTSLPDGTVGVDYTGNLQAVGGSGPRTWEQVGGDMPFGLGFDGDQIVGQPTEGGVFSFSVRVTDDNGTSTPRWLTLTIPALTVTTASPLPDGTINTPYPATQLTATNAYGTTTWSLFGGSFPAGMGISSAGVLSGTPTAGGSFNATVKVTDDGGSIATKALALTISSFAIITSATPGGYVGVPYAFALEAGGGTNYSWSVTVGSLPNGLALSTQGVISGTPTGVTSATFTVKVDAAGGKTASKQFTIATTASADWPQGQHDESHRAWNPGEVAIDSSNVAGINEEWQVEAALQPVIAGDKVYAAGEVPGRNGTYAPMALDLSTGDLAWYGPQLPAGCGGSAVAVTATLVLAQCNSVLAYSRTGGHALQWDTADTDPGVFTNQLLVIGTTAVAWGSDRVVAYRLSDGQRLWQQLLPGVATGVSDVAAFGTSVVVAYDDRVRALNATTGAQQWSRTIAAPGEIFIAGGFVYTRAGGGVSRYALADGAPGWSVLAGSGIYQLVGADGDTVYAFEAKFGDFGQESAVLRALRMSDGTQRWEQPLSTRLRSAAITKDLVWIFESQIYAWGRDSNMIAFRRTDGVERKRIHFDDNSYGPAAWGNGHVVLTQGGSSGGPDPYRLRSFGFTPRSPVITTKMVPTARVGTAYSTQLEAVGGSGALTWSLASGSLPGGLTLSPAGVISKASPSPAGSARVQVRVTDAKGRSRTRSLFVQVLGAGTNVWNAEGQDATRDGYNPAETGIGIANAAQLAYRWKTLTPGGTEQSIVTDHQPVVVGTSIYDVDKIGRLAAYGTTGTTANRAPTWTRTALDGAYYPDAPMESGGVLYLFDSNRYLDAVNASTGARIWHSTTAIGPNQYLRNELLVVGTKILFLDPNYDLVAYNTSDGSPAWGGAVVTLDGNELSGSPTLASDGTRAFVVATCEVHAITIATGAVAWPTVPVKAGGSTNCGVPSRMTPVVGDGAVFATTYDGSIAIEAATGVVRWRSGSRGGSGVIANGVWVLADAGGDDESLMALDTATGETLWKAPDLIAFPRLAVAGDLVVAGGTYNLYGFDLVTGEQVWDGGTPDESAYTNGGPIVAAGRIFVSTRDGIKAYGPP